MAVTVGSLLVSLGLDSAEFKSGLANAEKEFRRSTKRMEAIGASMANVGKNLTLAITAPLIALGVTSVKAAVESNQAIKSVEATLASMGAQAGFTAKQLEQVASGVMRKSLYDDDEVLRKVTNTMLTFGKVTGDTFIRAQQAAVDLSAKFGKDLQSSAIMVGKALNEPVKGLTALSRAGISFSPAQAQVIKSLVETGQAAKAQELILKELERQVLGSAQAMRDADPLAAMRLSFGEFQEEIGKKLLPLLPRLTDAITKVLDAFGKLSPGMQETVLIVAGLAAAFGPLLIVMGAVTTAIAPMIAGIKGVVAVSIAAGVQTGSLAVSLNVLRASVLSLIASLGPYAVALGLVGAALYIIIARSREGATASAQYREQQEKLQEIQGKVTNATERLATATGQARAEALANAKAVRQETIEYLANARAALVAARAKARQTELEARAVRFSAANAVGGSAMAVGGNFAAQRTDVIARQAATNAKAAAETVKGLEAEVGRLDAIINSSRPVIGASPVSSVGSSAGGGGGSRAKEQEDRTAEIQARFNSELYNYTQQNLSAMQQLAMSAEERADLELRSIEWARRQTLQEIAADEDYNAAQKAELSAAVERLAEYERAANDLNLRRELEREAADLAQVEFDSQREQLSLAADMADTQAERKRLALEILRLEQEYRRNQLEMVVASETASKAEKDRAQAILDSLAAIEAGERASVGRRNETELESFLRSYDKSPEQMGEERLGIGLEGIDRLIDGLSRIPGTVDSVKDAFKAMRDVFQSVIQDMLADLLKLQLRKALVGLIGSVLGGVGGSTGANSLGGGLAGIGARAMGGPVRAGMPYLVGERGPEVMVPGRSGRIIPNHELSGMGGNQTVFNVNVSGAMSDREARRTGHQIASAASQRMAQARRAGVAG